MRQTATGTGGHSGRSTRLLCALLAAMPVAAAPAPAGAQIPSRAPVAQRLEEMMKTPGFEHAHWGLLVLDAKTGKTVYERNADELFAPASTTKLFTVAAALIALGADYRFPTPIVRRGGIDDQGVLKGDLILVASGDLCMGGRTGPDGALLFEDDDHTYAGGNLASKVVASDPLAGLDHLAREVRSSGIREVRGEVIIDDRLFDVEPSTGSGPRFTSPIMINDNIVDVIARPAAMPGDPALVSIRPQTSYLAVDSQVETSPAGQPASIRVSQVGPRRYVVRGRLPVDHPPALRIILIDDPSSFARSLLIEALRRHGVKVFASPLGTNPQTLLPDRSATALLPKVAEYVSPPFRENAKVILKVSHNLHASTLPLLLAARHGERTLEQGLKREWEVLARLGIPQGTVSFGGGAGGSRADFATPRATVTLLRAMTARPEFSIFESALPVLGRDGTLAKAVPTDSPARGHAHAKTGTYFVENGLDGKILLTSKALAGYLETASGRSLVLAAFINNVLMDAPKPGKTTSQATAEAGRLLGKLCEILYDDQPGQPAPAASRAADQQAAPQSGALQRVD